MDEIINILEKDNQTDEDKREMIAKFELLNEKGGLPDTIM